MATHGQATAPAAPRVEPSRRAPRTSRRMVYLLVWMAVLGLGGWGTRVAADRYLRAMSVLIRLQNANAQGFATSFARDAVTEQEGLAQMPHGSIRYRLYVPQGVSHPGGMVLLDGIHRAGIDEPRLINFARSMAGAGVEVMTAELKDLADYKVTPGSVDIIGDSAVFLADKMGLPKVGVVGLSFGGGLAILAASKPEYADRIGFVTAVGPHDDMLRVARFFAANMIERPDGSTVALKAHEYGVLVLAYSHVEDFFSPRDAPVAREALRLWLWEQPSDSMQVAQKLSPAGRQQLDTILHHRELLQPALVQEIQKHSDEMEAVSPHGQISNLRVPVYLLHGSTDTVIPASETMWLAKDVPQQQLKAVLISPAMNMIHVDGQHAVTTSDKWALVDFMAQVLQAADHLGRAGR